MKKYIRVTLVIMALVAFNSCEDFTNQELQTQFDDTQVFNTEDGVEVAINGLYANYADPAYHGSSYHAFLAPHSGKFWSGQGATADATSLNCQTNNIWLEKLWPQMYETVNAANIIIDNLENTDLALANKDRALGDAYFIRAATYFDLVRLFGGVPLKTAPATFETLHTPRASKQEVYNLVIEDFNKAKTLLPDLGSEVAPGRPAKYAANMFLAKVYMQLAGEDGGNTAYWQNAYDEAIQVYGKYSLVSNYAQLFRTDATGFTENSSEAIFELQYDDVGGLRNSDVIRLYTPSKSTFVPVGQRTFGRVRPNHETFMDHVIEYGGGLNNIDQSLVSTVNDLNITDPRILETYEFSKYKRVNTSGGSLSDQKVYPKINNGNNGYAILRKYFDDTYNGVTTKRNMLKLRYADLLLMLAEIENELNGPANAFQYVNEVLTRARTTTSGTVISPADWSGMTQDTFRKRIMQEYSYELTGEGHEWFNARRRGYQFFLDNVINLHNNHADFGNKDYTYPIAVKNMLLPIPASEISGNQNITQADQNPGY